MSFQQLRERLLPEGFSLSRLVKPWGWLRRSRTFLLGGFTGGLLLLGAGYAGFNAFEYMDTPEFCVTCHKVMEPEYAAYQESPHARVNCVNCHIGKGASWLVRSKISGIRQVFATAGETFQRPIPSPVKNLRPARETCEQCHWPDKFSEDRIRFFRHFKEDEANTEEVRSLVYRIGGGASGEASGIHWHIASKVYYLPLDAKRQEIGWVGVETPEGTTREYFDPQRIPEVSPPRIQKEKRLMDCIDCHNRISHNFLSPEQLVDRAMAQGKIDPGLPYIKKEAVGAMVSADFDLELAKRNVRELVAFYQKSYPQVYARKSAAIGRSVNELLKIADNTVFSFMRTRWETHPNNLGHRDFPGCFRCHGKLVTTTETGENRTLSSECTLCHYPLPISPEALPPLKSQVQKPAPPQQEADAVPATTPSQEERALALYQKECSSCHGDKGGLLPSADLSSRSFLASRGEVAIFQGIAGGKGGMPAYGKAKGGKLNDEEISSLVAFIFSWAR